MRSRVEKELVLIDQHLNPKNNPSMLGRYRFSVAHELYLPQDWHQGAN